MAKSTLTDAGVTLADLLTDWDRHLRARNVSPATIGSYRVTAEQFVAFLVQVGRPTMPASITREHVESFLVARQAEGKAAATVAKAFRNLKQLFRWSVPNPKARSPARRWSA